MRRHQQREKIETSTPTKKDMRWTISFEIIELMYSRLRAPHCRRPLARAKASAASDGGGAGGPICCQLCLAESREHAKVILSQRWATGTYDGTSIFAMMENSAASRSRECQSVERKRDV